MGGLEHYLLDYQFVVPNLDLYFQVVDIEHSLLDSQLAYPNQDFHSLELLVLELEQQPNLAASLEQELQECQRVLPPTLDSAE